MQYIIVARKSKEDGQWFCGGVTDEEAREFDIPLSRRRFRDKFQTMQVTFKIQYNTRWGQNLCLIARDVKYPMNWNDGGVWTVTLPKCTAADLKDYTYVMMEGEYIRHTEWKHHSRKAAAGARALICEDSWIECPIPGCQFPREHKNPAFDRPGFRGAGTAVPVFSLRTPEDFGIGEFRDLRPLVDWVAATGQTIIQLLPVNDTTRKGEWCDSYPYNPVSTFALHPLYLRLQEIGVKQTARFKKVQKELNDLPELDYPRVFKEKMALIRQAFVDNGVKDMASSAFKRFRKENSFWLYEYAQFCAKRDGLEPEYYEWMQYHLDIQFSEEAAYACSKGVSFKGDLPIGVSADSAEAYWHPELFNLDSSAGAPPDFYSENGQNWGFPTYNWEEMEKDDFAWWKRRLRKMSCWFDAFRIDHILGFFRIWEIPLECKGGLMGHFNPALPYSLAEIDSLGLPVDGLFHDDPRNPGMFQPLIKPSTDCLQPWQKERFDALYNDFFYRRNDGFWKKNAERKLPELLGATRMLACGEDLGMVPDCVPVVMEREKVLSFEMVNMDKGRPWPYLSVCATSNHDMPTLRMQMAGDGGNAADSAPEAVRGIICDHLKSDSMLAVLPLQDWLALDKDLRRSDFMNERINQPANPDHHWCFRFHIDLNVLNSGRAEALTSAVRALLRSSGR